MDTEDKDDYTLEDDVWKDSFDKLLDSRPVLRELNILKENVHASYNLNSSVENSVKNESSLIVPPVIAVQPPKKCQKRHASISTPIVDRLASNPFKCSLSPIGDWKFRFFENKPKSNGPDFHATPINPEIVVCDYESEQEKSIPPNIFAISKELSLLPIQRKTLKSNNKRTGSQRRQVCFATPNQSTTPKEQDKNVEQPTNEFISKKSNELFVQGRKSISLHPGKWRKSLNYWRRTNHLQNTERKSTKVDQDESVQFVAVFPVSGRRKSVILKPERVSSNENSVVHSYDSAWERQVLQLCTKQKTLAFNQLYSSDFLENCRKIGEGAYGEVFLKSSRNKFTTDTVIKIIPIEGKLEINGEVQKTYEQILPEIVISTELHKLVNGTENSTSGFVDIKRTSCVRGKYPDHLIKLWEDYDDNKGSENDHPKVFLSDQIYIVLELGFGGNDLAEFKFNNAEQSYCALQQIILTLAVGEEACQFEHRDLHWGNVLILRTSEKHVSYKLNNIEMTVPTKGVKITIIDYTLSRMTLDNCCLYNDLSTDDELFSATGDYQFDIYRMMRDALKNNWESYEPKTNVFWISYIIHKMVDGVAYKNRRTKVHTTFIKKLKDLKDIVLNFKSAADCARYVNKKS